MDKESESAFTANEIDSNDIAHQLENPLELESRKENIAPAVIKKEKQLPNSYEVKNQEKFSKLAKFYEISRDMFRIHQMDHLCQYLIQKMQSVWSNCGDIIPLIEIHHQRFTLDKFDATLIHQFSAPIIVNHQCYGQVSIFYQKNDFSGWLDDEDSVFVRNIASDLGVWIEHQHLIGSTSHSTSEEIRVIKSVLDEHASIVINDGNWKIEYVNQKFCQIYQYSAEELLGQDIRTMRLDNHSEEFIRAMWNTLVEGKIWKGELRNRSKDGALHWMNTTTVPFMTGGVPYRYVSIRTEITDYKEIKQKMEQQVAELARSNDELEQFAYIVTHDLQEPLRAISSFVQLLKKYCDTQLDVRANELISHAVDGTVRMQMLIDDLLTYAQVNTSQTMVDIDCQQLLSNILIDQSIIINECDAIVTYDKLPTIKGISFQITQLFTNLINNALKFRREQPPRIHIGVKEQLEAWVFSVNDNGIGIEEQYLDRIFRVFQRLHSRKEYAGTGIGLAICKKVVDHHKGKMWVTSEPNRGSEFSFTISKTI